LRDIARLLPGAARPSLAHQPPCFDAPMPLIHEDATQFATDFVDLLSRVTGLLVAAIAVQLVASGVEAWIPSFAS